MCEQNERQGQISYFGFRFHKNSQTFSPGEEITGIVEIEANVEVYINGEIEVIFRAESLACWSNDIEEGSDTNEKNTIRCHYKHWSHTVGVYGEKGTV